MAAPAPAPFDDDDLEAVEDSAAAGRRLPLHTEDVGRLEERLAHEVRRQMRGILKALQPALVRLGEKHAHLSDAENRRLVLRDVLDAFVEAAREQRAGRVEAMMAYYRAMASYAHEQALEQLPRPYTDAPTLSASNRFVNPETEQYLREQAGTRIRGIDDTTLKQIRRGLERSYSDGERWSVWEQRIRTALGGDQPRGRAEMIARTELAWAYNTNLLASYKDIGVTHVRWVAMDDRQTCPGCAARSDRVFPLHEVDGQIPLHPRCRCTLMAEEFAEEPEERGIFVRIAAEEAEAEASAAAGDVEPVETFSEKFTAEVSKGLVGEADAVRVGGVLREEIEVRVASLQKSSEIEHGERQIAAAQASLQKVEAERDSIAKGTHPELSKLDEKRWHVERRMFGSYGAKKQHYQRRLSHWEQVSKDTEARLLSGLNAKIALLQKKLEEAMLKLEKARYRHRNPVILEVLESVRSFGGKTIRISPQSNPAVSGLLKRVYKYFPNDWVEASNKMSAILGEVSLRPFYNGVKSQICLSANGTRNDEADAKHEMGHRMENVVPRLQSFAREFLDRRTAGESPVSLKSLFPKYSYAPNEICKRDRFTEPYMGKLYPKDTEIVSMGIEGLFHHEHRLWTDSDYVDFMLGVLSGL